MSGVLPKVAEVDTVKQTLTIDGEPFPYPILSGPTVGLAVHAGTGDVPTITVVVPVESVTAHL